MEQFVVDGFHYSSSSLIVLVMALPAGRRKSEISEKELA